ncbi:uncharacterized protein LOC126795196 [Argentina anserina]|uniref:uncharacterized protein LOC126795196 n=1 Tax=Argentina anserina TaxID=57926 RepID=UPI0021768D9C|nr:uncharacterized protein LOC126795196 [Potentilla anserina]
MEFGKLSCFRHNSPTLRLQILNLTSRNQFRNRLMHPGRLQRQILRLLIGRQGIHHGLPIIQAAIILILLRNIPRATITAAATAAAGSGESLRIMAPQHTECDTSFGGAAETSPATVQRALSFRQRVPSLPAASSFPSGSKLVFFSFPTLPAASLVQQVSPVQTSPAAVFSDKTVGRSDDAFNTFFPRPAPASTSLAPSSSTSSPPSSTRSTPAPTASSSTPSSSSPARRTPPTPSRRHSQ